MGSWRCVVCGTCGVVIVRLPDVVVCYCSHDWLAVVVDGIGAGVAISWIHDEPVRWLLG